MMMKMLGKVDAAKMKAKQKQTQQQTRKFCEMNEFNMDELLIICYIRHKYNIYLTEQYFSYIVSLAPSYFEHFTAHTIIHRDMYINLSVSWYDKSEWMCASFTSCMVKNITFYFRFLLVFDLRIFQI